MKEKYFIVVNETKKEIYFASKNQFRAQHFTKFIYQKYDKHVSCVPRYLTQKEIEMYKMLRIWLFLTFFNFFLYIKNKV